MARQGGHGVVPCDSSTGNALSRSQPMRLRILSDNELQTFANCSPEEVCVLVDGNESEFLNCFKSQKYCSDPSQIRRLIKLLHLLTGCSNNPTVASRIIAQIFSAAEDYALFRLKLAHLLKGMAMEVPISPDNLSCVHHLVEIGLVAIEKIPTVVLHFFPFVVLKDTVDELHSVVGEAMRPISLKFLELNVNYTEVKLQALTEKLDQLSLKQKKSKDSEGEPPEPFTELSVLPGPGEIHMVAKNVYLRSNKIKGGYDSWAHYLDIQFRLLREDFIRPLRNGIAELRYQGPSRQISDIRVYEGAKVLNPVCVYTGIAFQVRFDAYKLGNVNWDHSRRLIFGSLLCLSNDNFEQCLLFATVVKRDSKLLSKGLLTIKFESSVNAFQIDPNESYTMVESTAYYEAYRHVLERLQKMPCAAPIRKCVVAENLRAVDFPDFLRAPMNPPRFNMTDVFTKRPDDRLPPRLTVSKVFNVTNPHLWPGVQYTHLDDSQLQALKMALSKEVAIIQGPPGTGKTYIGLTIVETYLKNRAVWDPEKSAPILVVCYTNHALDQFLEGIHALSIDGMKPDIIRVGGRCKSVSLANYTLREKVQEEKSFRRIPRNIYKPYQRAREALFKIKDRINDELESSDAESQQKVVSLSKLKPVMDERHFVQFSNTEGVEEAPGQEMEIWLRLWFQEVKDDESQVSQISQAVNPQKLPTKPQTILTALKFDESDVVSSDDDAIEIDKEAILLQEGRMIEGEEIELPERPVKRSAEVVAVNTRSIQPTAEGWKTVQLREGHRRKLVSRGFKNAPMSSKEVSKVTDIWKLSLKKRWSLYIYWTNKYIELCKERINDKADDYNTACADFHRTQQEIDCHVAAAADVIGMTTTGAAKYHHLLKSTCPKIVIFEEAAEVLEAHVTTALTSSVEQLILIGDHKQLRPKPTCYDLEKDYNLDVSLFERLIENDFEHVTLEKQHRMRPEVSKLICPIIYERLLDADSVKQYDHVMGVGKDVFFIDHAEFEESNYHSDSKSHVNKHEAEYIVELCHYLLKQGYKPQEITILTMYRGQLLEFKNRMKKEHFEGVRVAAVDDFQGEENKIILLSLVRSNPEKSIGFLSIENRVCVSLSRAKQGLYVIGNMNMLREKHNTKWPAIIYHLEREQAVGPALPLYCQVHQDNKVAARLPDDFRKRPEGGCTKVCGTMLPCGHACRRKCHPTDRDHKLTKCSSACGKTLPCGHNCVRKCHECQRSCSSCLVQVLKTLPCGHQKTISCSIDPSDAYCMLPCENSLPCGHICPNHCSAICAPVCTTIVSQGFELPCGHTTELQCFQDPESVVCSVKCPKVLECGDICSGTCGKCQRGRLHVKCLKMCEQVMVCGNPCKHHPCSVCIGLHHAKTVTFQQINIPKLLEVNTILGRIHPDFSASSCTSGDLQQALFTLEQFLKQEVLSTQQISDCVSELRRISCATRLLRVLFKYRDQVSLHDKDNILLKLERARLSGWKHAVLTEVEEKDIMDFVCKIRRKYKQTSNLN